MLTNKKIYFLGSSITYGFSSNGYAIPEMLRDKYGAICYKNAITGTTLANLYADSYYARLINDKSNFNPDLFVCQLSTNDTNLPSFGAIDSKDVKDTVGAIRKIIEYVENKWQIPIVFYTSPFFRREKYQELVKILYQIKREYKNLYILDLYNDHEFNSQFEQGYMADDIHPTLIGYEKWWLPYFANFFEEIFKKAKCNQIGF